MIILKNFLFYLLIVVIILSGVGYFLDETGIFYVKYIKNQILYPLSHFTYKSSKHIPYEDIALYQNTYKVCAENVYKNSPFGKEIDELKRLQNEIESGTGSKFDKLKRSGKIESTMSAIKYLIAYNQSLNDPIILMEEKKCLNYSVEGLAIKAKSGYVFWFYFSLILLLIVLVTDGVKLYRKKFLKN